VAVPGSAVPAATPVGPGGLMPPGRGQPPVTGDTRSAAQKLVGAAAAASVFVALALFFLTDHWQWFLLIPAISAIAGSIWGPDWKEPNPGAGDGRQRLRNDRIRDDRHRRRELGD